ncbi:MAG: hemolysin family protein [Actinomycetota bacterium]|nr:HlyC/CorC family transporter [Acidimicrobiia bacterium]MDQ3294000.1 hemolysin family protein [Actinomycetota bacterium]
MLVLATAFFVAVEFALVAVDRSRVAILVGEGDGRAKVVAGLLRRLSFHLSGAQLGITVTSVALGFLAEPAVAEVVEPAIGRGPAIAVALVLATVFQMVIGELVPKSLAIAGPERTALRLARPAALYGRLLGPLITVFNAAANAIVRRLGVEPTEELTSVRSLEELELLIRSSGEEGEVAPEAYSVLRRALRFGKKTAADALVPRVDTHWIQAEAPVSELVELAVGSGRSRFPVCGADLDDVVGVVHVKDVYRLPFEARGSEPVGSLMQAPWVVPETADLAALLGDFRALGTPHLAVVVDEYGGTAGILTLEDVLEELVGEIDDEYDPAPAPTPQALPAGIHEVAGTLHPDEVADATAFGVPDGPYETLAGYVLDRLGRIPEPGARFTEDGWTIEVLEMERRRVATVRLTAPEPGARADADDGARDR